MGRLNLAYESDGLGGCGASRSVSMLSLLGFGGGGASCRRRVGSGVNGAGRTGKLQVGDRIGKAAGLELREDAAKLEWGVSGLAREHDDKCRCCVGS